MVSNGLLFNCVYEWLYACLVATRPRVLCEISKITLETASKDNLHNKCFEAKPSTNREVFSDASEGEETRVLCAAWEQRTTCFLHKHPFHVWLNRNLTIHPYWCTGVYRIQNRSRKYLQTCFLPMQEKRLDYSIEQGNITLGKRWSQFK